MSFERDCITQGNAFLTSEEAKFESDKRKVIAELKRYAYDFCEEEWRDMDIDKYYMFYDYEFDSFNVSYRQTFKYLNEINFKSEEDADKAIKDVGEDRIKKYLFGIES